MASETSETLAEIVAEIRELGNYQQYSGDHARQLADRIEEAAKRERRLLKSCARWIFCHDIYGHMAKELLAECKEVLNDDGRFLFKEDEQ